MRPQFLLRRRPQHHLWNLDEIFIAFRKLESGILEGLAKIVELGKIHMAGGARSAILARESRDRITASGQHNNGENKGKNERHPTRHIHCIASLAVEVVAHSLQILKD